MVDSTGGPDVSGAHREFELQRMAALSELLKHALRFAEQDIEANGYVLRLAKVAVEHAEKHPETVFTGSRANIDELVAALKGGGTTGADIVGGDTIDDIIKIIDELIKLLTGGEKDFWLQIIKLVLCGCDGKGW